MGTRQVNRDANVDDFVVSDEAKIKWSRDLKLKLKSGTTTNFSQEKVRYPSIARLPNRTFTLIEYEQSCVRLSIHLPYT